MKDLVEAYYAVGCCSRAMCNLSALERKKMSPLIEITKNRVEAQLDKLFANRLKFKIIPAKWRTVNGSTSAVWYSMVISGAYHRVNFILACHWRFSSLT